MKVKHILSVLIYTCDVEGDFAFHMLLWQQHIGAHLHVIFGVSLPPTAVPFLIKKKILIQRLQEIRGSFFKLDSSSFEGNKAQGTLFTGKVVVKTINKHNRQKNTFKTERTCGLKQV